MSKAFTRDADDGDDDLPEGATAIPKGLQALRDAFNQVDRPRVVEAVSRAAENGLTMKRFI